MTVTEAAKASSLLIHELSYTLGTLGWTGAFGRLFGSDSRAQDAG